MIIMIIYINVFIYTYTYIPIIYIHTLTTLTENNKPSAYSLIEDSVLCAKILYQFQIFCC